MKYITYIIYMKYVINVKYMKYIMYVKYMKYIRYIFGGGYMRRPGVSPFSARDPAVLFRLSGTYSVVRLPSSPTRCHRVPLTCVVCSINQAPQPHVISSTHRTLRTTLTSLVRHWHDVDCIEFRFIHRRRFTSDRTLTVFTCRNVIAGVSRQTR